MIMQEEGDDQNEQHIQYIDKDNNAAFTVYIIPSLL